MKHWSVNTGQYLEKDPISYAKWHAIQLINNGLGVGEKLDPIFLAEIWTEIKPELDPYKARTVEYLLWDQRSSLPTNLNSWNWSGKNQT